MLLLLSQCQAIVKVHLLCWRTERELAPGGSQSQQAAQIVRLYIYWLDATVAIYYY